MANPDQTTDPINMLVGAHLRATRKAKGVSQEELGRGCGITQQQVQKYETGANRLSVAMMIRASSVIGVAAQDLLPTVMTGEALRSHQSAISSEH